MSTNRGRRVYTVKQEITVVTEKETVRRSPRFLSSTCKEDTEQKAAVKREPHISSLPEILFTGKINYASNFYDCAMICDDIIQEIEQHKDDIVPIGFDLEWPFSFQTGSGKTALAQICHNESVCHLLHVYSLDKLPAAFVVLLTHPKVRLVGVNIKNDIWKLGRDFKHFPAKKVVEENCIDCEKKINKNPKVRRSKWHIQPLSEAQKIYAATDAYVSLLTYLMIQERSIEETMLNCEEVQ
ncbi:hypothetical protein KPH14_009026 [Odynerus spinipes]|uniref:3'-5' exonuclease n=1 Tax=Odynerus spinipes TaxID=1348599 RepID=A0AAD9RNG8_9HYME|nr:hypothetical protein KPH14_009026 [Odynerus spinipes]